jgi:hypothetical protein
MNFDNTPENHTKPELGKKVDQTRVDTNRSQLQTDQTIQATTSIDASKCETLPVASDSTEKPRILTPPSDQNAEVRVEDKSSLTKFNSSNVASQGLVRDTVPVQKTSDKSVSDFPTDSIPGYQIQPEIARGGMGVVYAARDLIFEREVAIKIMKPGMSVPSFEREARIAARLAHPGIPAIHALGTLPNGLPYLVMKLVRGETLDKILSRRHQLTEDQGKFLAIFELICQAVGYAHSQGIIHRDLKPSNVMVGAFGEVQVMDWGLARDNRKENATEAASDGSSDSSGLIPDSAFSMPGQVKGTPSYMSPEQARGDSVDTQTDVFALGGILAVILTGQPPFTGNSTLAKAASGDVEEIMQKLDACGADQELVSLCKQCLSAEAETRPENSEILATSVANYRAAVEAKLHQAEQESAAHAARLEEQKKRRRLQAVLSSVILLTFASGALLSSWFAWQSSNEAKAARLAEQTAKMQEKLADLEKEKAENETIRAENNLRIAQTSSYISKLQLAQNKYEGKNLIEAWNNLNDCQWNLRGWEHAYLRKQFDNSNITLYGHKSRVSSANFSPDGKLVVTGSWDGTAKVWDTQTGKIILNINGHDSPIVSVCFSPDGKRILTATGGLKRSAKIWDANSGSELMIIKGDDGVVECASFSPDGSKILTVVMYHPKWHFG